MPLTAKGKKILASMRETYGDDEEAKRVFYASANAKKIKGVHKVKDGLIAVTDADGHVWTRGVHLSDDDTLLDAVTKHRDGYLTCEARVARTGLQRYRGYELGMPDREHVVLFRPAEEVFARDSMRSMANKPITLTHPKQMVDSKSWSKVAKGFSGSEVVRDGEYVRVPLMLTDSAAIDAFENGNSRELSVGYTTDIDWTAGETPDGVAYDGVQRQIRGNHHALVPVARGGDQLRFGDSALEDFSPDQPRGDDGKWAAGQETAAEKNKRQNPDGADLKPEDYDDNDQNWPTTSELMGVDINAPERKPNVKIPKGSPFENADSRSASDAASSGTAEEGVMPVIKQFDGIPISFHDEASAATMEREFRKLQLQLADDFGGKKAKPFGSKDGNGNGNGDDDDDDSVEAKRKKVTAEDALKKDIATRDGEIAVLKKQLADAVTTEAKVEAMAAERIALIDAARPFLPKDFKDAGKSLADIRRAVVSTSFTDAEMKDWTDDQIIGAFRTMSKVGAGASKGGATAMADSMSAGMRSTAGYVPGNALADGEKQVTDAYNDYVKGLNNAYREPFKVVRN